MGALADVEITMHYTPSEQFVTRFLMPKDCANIYGQSNMVTCTFWAYFRTHFDYNLHFIDCLFMFVVSLGRTILFVMAL